MPTACRPSSRQVRHKHLATEAAQLLASLQRGARAAGQLPVRLAASPAATAPMAARPHAPTNVKVREHASQLCRHSLHPCQVKPQHQFRLPHGQQAGVGPREDQLQLQQATCLGREKQIRSSVSPQVAGTPDTAGMGARQDRLSEDSLRV